MKDPIGTVRKLYKQFGWEVTAEFEAAMRSYLEKNAKDREAAEFKKMQKFHAYSLEEYGLDKAQVKDALKWYYDKYGL